MCQIYIIHATYSEDEMANFTNLNSNGIIMRQQDEYKTSDENQHSIERGLCAR